MTVSHTTFRGLPFGVLIVSQRHHDVHIADPAFLEGVFGGECLPLCLWTRRPKKLFAITAVGFGLY